MACCADLSMAFTDISRMAPPPPDDAGGRDDGESARPRSDRTWSPWPDLRVCARLNRVHEYVQGRFVPQPTPIA